MPRASRYFMPGHVWHVTHHCHRQEFLLKFARDQLILVRPRAPGEAEEYICITLPSSGRTETARR